MYIYIYIYIFGLRGGRVTIPLILTLHCAVQVRLCRLAAAVRVAWALASIVDDAGNICVYVYLYVYMFIYVYSSPLIVHIQRGHKHTRTGN